MSTMAVTTDMQNVQIQMASVEGRLNTMDYKLETMGEKLEEMEERADERHEHVREFLRGAVRDALLPLDAKLTAIEAERKALFSVAAKAAGLIGGGITFVWGVVQAMLQ